MNIVLDACAIINLVHGSVFDTVLSLKHDQFCVGSLTLEECGDEPGVVLRSAVNAKKVALLDDDLNTAKKFLALLEQYGLGDGETESLAFAQSLNYVICTDDKKARTVSTSVLGEGRVTGSLGLLKSAVQQQRLTASEAFAAYQKMKTAGGFLPDVDLSFFLSKHKGTA